MKRSVSAVVALVLGGFAMSDTSKLQLALGLSFIGVAFAIPALLLVLRLMLADKKRAGGQVDELDAMTERAARLDRST